VANGDWVKWSGLTNVLAANSMYAYSIQVANVSPYPYGQLASVSGNPYSGGQIGAYFSSSGTSTAGTGGSNHPQYDTSGKVDGVFDISLSAICTAPNAPTIGTPVPGNNSVTISWTPPASGPTTTGYNIKRSTTSGAETTLAAGANVSGTSFTDYTAVNGTHYYYVVSGLNGGCESVNSGEVSATPMSCNAPNAPTISAAAPGNNSVIISWTPPASGPTPSGYNVKRSTTSGAEVTQAAGANVSGSPFTDTTAVNGTTYYYVVSALNGACEGDNSGEVSATPCTSPNAPTIGTATPGNNSVTVTWTPPASGPMPSGYNVKRSTTSGAETTLAAGADVSGSPFTDTTAANGTTYYYVVSAFQGSCESANSSEVSATPSVLSGGPTLTDLGSTTPVPGPFDIAQLSINGISFSPGGLNYYDDNDSPPGQTFTTGANPSGYALSTLAIKTGGQDSYGDIGTPQPYTLRIYSVSGSTATLLTTYVSGDVTFSDGDWLQWSGLTNVLLPNTTYAYSFHNSTGFELMANASVSLSGGVLALLPAGNGTITTASGYSATFDAGLAPPGTPAITSLTITPATNYIYAGTPVTLNVSATGTTPLYYLWQTDNGSGGVAFTNLSGLMTTSSFVLNTTNLVPGLYEFQVIVSNSVYAVTSRTLTLSVAPNTGGWVVDWSDEFNESNIDLTKWTFDIGNNGGWGNAEQEYYTSSTSNAYVAGGLLHIAVQQQSYDGYNYTSARMKSLGLFSQTYGLIEWRASLPQGLGFWPALWMMGTNFPTAGWPECGEIDVMESQGSWANQVQGTIHWADVNGDQQYSTLLYSLPTEGDSTTNFHTYAVEWTTNALTWLVDGQAVQTWTDWGATSGPYAYPAPFNQPFFLLMNVAVGGNYLGDPSDDAINAGTTFPGEMQVDYVRAYTWVPPYNNGATTNFYLSASPMDLALNQGDNGVSVIAVNALNGFTGSVNLSVSGLPDGVTATFAPSNTMGTSTLTFSAGNMAAGGEAAVTITGISGSLTNTATVNINVGSCPPTLITPYLQDNGGSWVETNQMTIASGDTVTFGPQPVTGGESWSWSGPDGFSSDARQITVSNITISVTYIATYVNDCGTPSYEAFFVTVPGTQIFSSQFSSGSLILDWTQGTLLSATNLLGPWLPVAGASSPYTNKPGGSQKFFRIQLP
jgi:beta-glucanase (GH16 family)/fibronectin type 3 domain-containing protein